MTNVRAVTSLYTARSTLDAFHASLTSRSFAEGMRDAPGGPGIAPTWASSAKDFVTTALGGRVWATLGFGIVNEVYWPFTGEPQLRDLGFLVRIEDAWFEVKREASYTLSTPRPDVPLVTVVHEHPAFRISLDVVPDPARDALLIRYELTGGTLYALLAPHLGGSGGGNTAWVGRGLHAVRGDRSLALLASGGFSKGSAGFVGVSDGWQDFREHGAMTWTFDRAQNGNVALTGELREPSGVLALGFALTPRGAEVLAASSLASGFDTAARAFESAWGAWGDALALPTHGSDLDELARLSAAVMKVHEDGTYKGAVVASLSVPWGQSRDDLGGYHLVWPRDAVQSGFALLAASQMEDARALLAYLAATQSEDGHWPQNFFPDGRPYWSGTQLDETALPVLLAAKLSELGELEDGAVVDGAVRNAVRYLVRHGPMSPQDRWEENAGANPYTLATMIAALVAGAAWLPPDEGAYALAFADDLNERVEALTYVEDTDLARAHGVAGYYVRLSPDGEGAVAGRVTVRNRAGLEVPAAALVSVDFTWLVRLGLRRADDPRVTDTLKVVNEVLRVDTPSGPLYHRYNEDGYGEHPDGSPFDGSGVGRAWPLLSGEVGHVALLRGEDVTPYLETMRRTASPGGLLPEQAWDAAPIPGRFLFPGRPTGSAMPLLWAHAEYLKLYLARTSRRPIELLSIVEERYGAERPAARVVHWRTDLPAHALPSGRALSVEATEPFTLHFGWNGWRGVEERAAAQGPFGVWRVRFEAAELAAHDTLQFTRRFEHGWEGRDHEVRLGREHPSALPPA